MFVVANRGNVFCSGAFIIGLSTLQLPTSPYHADVLLRRLTMGGIHHDWTILIFFSFFDSSFSHYYWSVLSCLLYAVFINISPRFLLEREWKNNLSINHSEKESLLDQTQIELPVSVVVRNNFVIGFTFTSYLLQQSTNAVSIRSNLPTKV